jgi:hypothetical protein
MEITVNDIADFKTQLALNPSLQKAFKIDPVAAANNIHQMPLESDKWVYRVVVGALGSACLFIITAVLMLMNLIF